MRVCVCAAKGRIARPALVPVGGGATVPGGAPAPAPAAAAAAAAAGAIGGGGMERVGINIDALARNGFVQQMALGQAQGMGASFPPPSLPVLPLTSLAPAAGGYSGVMSPPHLQQQQLQELFQQQFYMYLLAQQQQQQQQQESLKHSHAAPTTSILIARGGSSSSSGGSGGKKRATGVEEALQRDKESMNLLQLQARKVAAAAATGAAPHGTADADTICIPPSPYPVANQRTLTSWGGGGGGERREVKGISPMMPVE